MALVELGYISGFHGVKGWLKVFSYTSPRENIFNYSSWQVRYHDNWLEFVIEKYNSSSKGLLVKLEGIDDRTGAEDYFKAKIAIKEQDLQDLKPGEYYWRDLIGLEVINQNRQNLGVVKDLMETGANDVLVVVTDAKRRLIPYTPGAHITKIDKLKGVIFVNWDDE